MRRIRFKMPNVKFIFTTAIITSIMFFNTCTWAVNIEDTELEVYCSKDFIEWQQLNEEEKENTLMPRISTPIV